MTLDTIKYVRKPFYVDAIQVTPENFGEIVHWCQGEIINADGSDLTIVDGFPKIKPSKQYILIRVHNPHSIRHTKAFVGDWVLYTDKGYKVYTDKALRKDFEVYCDDRINTLILWKQFSEQEKYDYWVTKNKEQQAKLWAVLTDEDRAFLEKVMHNQNINAFQVASETVESNNKED